MPYALAAAAGFVGGLFARDGIAEVSSTVRWLVIGGALYLVWTNSK